MTFQAKRDRFFMTMIGGVLLLIFAVTAGPIVYELFFANTIDWAMIVVLLLTMILTCGFILWLIFDMEYTFQEEHLLVRGGPFRSKIPYEEITKMNDSTQIFVGYRVLSSKDALEIHYKRAFLGSVIISPAEKETFKKELLKRAPNMSYIIESIQ